MNLENKPRKIKYPALSIPNILSYIRLLLIPIFVWIYLTAHAQENITYYYIAAAIVAVSGITDFLDGFIARKFDMITDLGKFIDPLADKLTQLALIACLIVRYPLMWLLVVIYVVKEGFMAGMGLVMLKVKKRKLDHAEWFGKVSTAVLFMAMIGLVAFPDMPEELATTLILICGGFMSLAFALYIPVFAKIWNEE